MLLRLVLVILVAVAAPLARAQTAAHADVPQLRSPLANRVLPSPAIRSAAPFAFTAYDADSFDGMEFVDVEEGTRAYDDQGRLASEEARTLDSFGGRLVTVRATYTYGPDGVTAIVHEREEDGTLTPTDRDLYTYDNAGRVTTITEEFYSGTDFVPSAPTVYTYDAHNVPVVTLSQVATGGTSVNADRETLSEDGTRLTALSETWAGSTWENEGRTVFDNLSFQDLGTFALLFNPDGGVGVFGTLAVIYADFDSEDVVGPISVAVDEEWTSSGWVNELRTSVTRAEDRITKLLVEEWDGSTWTNVSRTLFGYDAEGRPSAQDAEFWDGTQWVLLGRESFTYDADGNTGTFLLV